MEKILQITLLYTVDQNKNKPKTLPSTENMVKPTYPTLLPTNPGKSFVCFLEIMKFTF